MYKYNPDEPNIKELIEKCSSSNFKQIIRNNSHNTYSINKYIPTFYYNHVFHPISRTYITPISFNQYYLIDYIIQNNLITTNIILKSQGVNQIQVLLNDSNVYTIIDYDSIIDSLTDKKYINYKAYLLVLTIICLYKLIR